MEAGPMFSGQVGNVFTVLFYGNESQEVFIRRSVWFG